jgi:hypothetical protein
MRIITIALLTTLATLAPAQAQDVRFHDAQGRVTGSARTDANGVTTFHDRVGRVTGTARTDRNGVTTFHDAAGRTTARSGGKDETGRRRTPGRPPALAGRALKISPGIGRLGKTDTVARARLHISARNSSTFLTEAIFARPAFMPAKSGPKLEPISKLLGGVDRL